MSQRIFPLILLVLALFFLWSDFTPFVNASGPYFSIVNAKRTYHLDEKQIGSYSYGYDYNITIKNIGDKDPSVVKISICPEGTGGETSEYFDWNTGEVKSAVAGFRWPEQSMVAPARWTEVITRSNFTQPQTLLIYFDTVLDVYANPPEYPQEVTISGKLMNRTSGVGISNQDLRLFINGSRIANIQTDSDGSYTCNVLLPTYGTHKIYIVWSYGEGAVGLTYVTVRTPTILSISLSSSTTLIGFKVDVNGRLTYTNGSGVLGTAILLAYSVTGGQSWNDITSINTATDGSYSAQWIPSATGVYMVKASWAGKWDKGRWILGANATVSLAVTPFASQYVFSVLSNSTVSALAFNSTSRELSFTVSGPSGTTGYVNVTIAKPLIGDVADLKVYLNGTETTYAVKSIDDSWLLHFTYYHSINNIKISLGPLGEAPSIVPLIETETVVAIISVIIILGAAFGLVYFLRLRKRETSSLPSPKSTQKRSKHSETLFSV